MTAHAKKFIHEVRETPYRPSWIDRLIEWINHLPIPVWLFYTLGILFVAFLINIGFWIDGSLPFGSIDVENTIFSILVFYWLALYQYLSRVGSKSLQVFSQLLEAGNVELARVDYELTTLPRWLGWLAVPAGIGLGVLSIFSDPQPYGDFVPQSIVVYMIDIVLMGFLVSTFICLIIRSIRQLKKVDRLHERATNINLLKLGPVHAFSSLTAQTGIGFILLLIISYFLDPTALGNALDIFLYSTVSLLAIAAFVIPIMGMRETLKKEKERALNKTVDLLQMTTENLHNTINQGDYENLEGMENAINALIRERELLEKVSTWPWNPATIRSFSSALLLPIFLWLVTQLLDRVI